MKFNFKLLSYIMVLCLLLTGCISDRPADDKIYPAERTGDKKQKIAVIDTEIDTGGVQPFISMEEIQGNLQHRINLLLMGACTIINISPDGESIYYMKEAEGGIRGYKGYMIKGRDSYQMDLLWMDVDTGTSEVLDYSIPIISRAEWNNTGDVLALMGGNHLTLYNAESHKLIIPDELQNKQVSHFGWGPNGKKIFTEHPYLPNGSKIYVDSGSIVDYCTNDEELYYNGQLDENYYYGTYIYVPGEAESKQGAKMRPETVLIDKKGQIVKFLGEGRFRDAYGRSVLQLGKNLFGLYYTPDINHADKRVKLSGEYIYDARFIYDGKFAYIIKSPEVEKNTFLLCIADQEGKLIKKFEITGNCLVLAPDGRSAYTKGYEEEGIDFTSMSLDPVNGSTRWNNDVLGVYETVRGALDSYCRFIFTGEKDLDAVKKYFIDSHNPEQWAYFDMTTYMKETAFPEKAENYVIDIREKDLYINGNRAEIFISFDMTSNLSTSLGPRFTQAWSAELIKKDNRWYITGLSTFPNSQASQEVMKVVESFIADKQHNSELKDKEVSIGQIQFWEPKRPYLAWDSKQAEYCKVYLKVKEDSKESIYKLVLHKEKDWMIHSLSKDNLSGLF